MMAHIANCEPLLGRRVIFFAIDRPLWPIVNLDGVVDSLVLCRIDCGGTNNCL